MRNLKIITEIQESWGWIGLDPAEIVGENDFGNLMIKDTSNVYWRLCPEDLYCEIIAKNREEFDQLLDDQEFLEDWYMKLLVQKAKDVLGPLSDGYKYGLVIPGPLGGEYGISNVKMIPLVELIGASGDIAKQIKDLPDGTRVKLKVNK